VPVDPHLLAEQRSLAAHMLIAARLADEPQLLEGGSGSRSARRSNEAAHEAQRHPAGRVGAAADPMRNAATRGATGWCLEVHELRVLIEGLISRDFAQ
jgi:hypothetical protein